MSQVNFLAYYKALEEDVEKLSRYIEITEDNFNVYSVELTRLYLSICSEVDVLLKLLCEQVSGKKPNENINYYREVIQEYLPRLANHEIHCSGLREHIKPWEEFEAGQSPSWWKYHNKVKHRRSEYYSKANLRNVLYALSGLFILVVYYCHYSKLTGIEERWWGDIDMTLRGIHKICNFFQIIDMHYAYALMEG